MDLYQEYIYTSRYARYVEEENRRETWPETVKRYFDFMEDHLKENNNYILETALRQKLETAVLEQKIMPSMRALAMAGPALKRENLCAYNCSYVPVDSPRAFDEILYILMNGVGVGFSVERQYINKLPPVNEHFEKSDSVIVVGDTKAGWARALRELISMLYAGQVPNWDTSKLRKAGERLKTSGGRASGPEPLIDVFKFIVATFKGAAGRVLTSVECHDIVCKIAECVIVGGVRRSALISMSNLSDDRMRIAKSGEWWHVGPQRSFANNSAVYTEKPGSIIFMEEWLSLIKSNSGERGIFSRYGAAKQAARNERRVTEDFAEHYGLNPCGEIVLRPNGLCNLTSVIIRSKDTLEDVAKKIEMATILGTFQSTLTNFKYLRKDWKKNADDERLLGVSLSGIKDHAFFSGKSHDLGLLGGMLDRLRNDAIKTNKKWAKILGIPVSAAITCIKPEGNSSQWVNSSSGIHDRWSEYYIRTVRSDRNDPLATFMAAKGFPVEPCVINPNTTLIFSFPVKSPSTAVFRDSMTAIEQLELWKVYKEHWCEHNASITVYVKEHEWLEVGAWVYKNFDTICGVSFLPYANSVYRQAPYQEITKEEYEVLAAKLPTSIDWSELAQYEKEDTTTVTQELACVGGGCEI